MDRLTTARLCLSLPILFLLALPAVPQKPEDSSAQPEAGVIEIIPPEGFFPPEPPKKPPAFKKSVPVIFCVVDDKLPAGCPKAGLPTNPGLPRGRFNRKALLDGLAEKNKLYKGTGITFSPLGKTLVIPDPHPNCNFKEGGEVGDVADPGKGLRQKKPQYPGDYDPLPGSIQGLSTFPAPSPFAVTVPTLPPGSFLVTLPPGGPAPGSAPRQEPKPVVTPDGATQLRTIQDNCLKKAGANARGALVEVVIRRFVKATDNDGDGRFDEDTTFDGINQDGDRDKNGIARNGEDGIEIATIRGKAAVPPCSQVPPAVRRAPTVVDPFQPAAGRKVNLALFGFHLAHENGHALCLDHAKVGKPLPRLMSPTVPPYTPGFSGPETKKLQAQVCHLSKARQKNAQGLEIPRRGPTSRYAFDDAYDADPAVDVFAAAAGLKEDGATLGLLLELTSPVPDGPTPVYTLSLDLDASADTGVTLRPRQGEALSGVDLQLVARLVASPAGAAAGDVLVTAYAERAGELVAIEVPGLYGLLLPTVFPGDDRPDTVLNHSLFVVVPPAGLPRAPAEGFRMIAEAASADGELYDRAPTVVGSLEFDGGGPVLRLEPTTALAGDVVTLYGDGYQPGGEVLLFVGGESLGSVGADDAGSFSTTIIAPEPEEPTAFADGSDIVPVMAAHLPEAVTELADGEMVAGGGDVALLVVSGFLDAQGASIPLPDLPRYLRRPGDRRN